MPTRSGSSRMGPSYDADILYRQLLFDIRDLLQRELTFETGLDLVRKLNVFISMDPSNVNYADVEYINTYLGQSDTQTSGTSGDYFSADDGQSIAMSTYSGGYGYESYADGYSQAEKFSDATNANYQHGFAPQSSYLPPSFQGYQPYYHGAPNAANHGAASAPTPGNYYPPQQSVRPSSEHVYPPQNPPAPYHELPTATSEPLPRINHEVVDISDDDEPTPPIQLAPPLVPNWDQIANRRYLSATVFEQAMYHVKDNITHGVWEKQLIADVIVGPNVAIEVLRNALEAPKNCTAAHIAKRKLPHADLWERISQNSCRGQRSKHLVVNHFWGMIKDCSSIRRYNDFTGGDGDGNANHNAGILEKIGWKLKQVQDAGIPGHENLSTEKIHAWTTPAGDSLFDMLDAKLVESKHPCYQFAEYHDGQPGSSQAQLSRKLPSRKTSSHSFPGSHNLPSSSSSTGPSRNTPSFSRHSGTAASSPLSTRARPARPFTKKSASQTSQVGRVKSESGSQNGTPSESDAEKLKAKILEKQDSSVNLIKTRMETAELHKDFLISLKNGEAQVRESKAKAIEIKAKTEMAIAINQENRTNIESTLAMVNAELANPKLGEADRLSYSKMKVDLIQRLAGLTVNPVETDDPAQSSGA